MRIAVLYEHPEWFQPLFAVLKRRGLEYVPLHAARLVWDPRVPPPFALVVNRMSPSAYLRGHANALHATAAFLDYVESHGVPVVNGSAAYRLETSKAAQLDLFERLAVPHPRARVINHPRAAAEACRGLRFPVVVKPNVGGSGAGITRFDTPGALEAAASDRLDLGPDGAALVQEFLPSRDGAITRVEVLDGRLLYAIRITPPAGHGFNLCPADICQQGGDEPAGPEEGSVVSGQCATKPGMEIEATSVPDEVIGWALTIARRARLDVCGIEFLVDERDARPYVYDVNALSNFVTDAPRVVGFDPFERFADFIERRVRETAAQPSGAAAHA